MIRLSMSGPPRPVPPRPVRVAVALVRGVARATAMASVLAACGRSHSDAEVEQRLERQRQDAHVREVVAAGGVVDSIVPVTEALRRFRTGTARVDTLRHASRSREALLARLTSALRARDTADLSALLLDRSEFAWLFYEASPLSRPPYEAPPSLLWGQMVTASDRGVRELLERFGGTAVRVQQLACAPPDIEGRNRLHKRCTVRFTAPGRPALAGNLFGTILERDGRFKLLSYANRI